MGSESPEHFGDRLLQLTEGISVGDVTREVFLRGIPRDVLKTLVNHAGTFADLTEKAGTFFTTSGAAINATDMMADSWSSSPQRPFSRPFSDGAFASTSAEPVASASAAGHQHFRQPPRQRQSDARAPRSRQGGGDVEHQLCRYHKR